jgi:hypothetical protein
VLRFFTCKSNSIRTNSPQVESRQSHLGVCEKRRNRRGTKVISHTTSPLQERQPRKTEVLKSRDSKRLTTMKARSNHQDALSLKRLSRLPQPADETTSVETSDHNRYTGQGRLKCTISARPTQPAESAADLHAHRLLKIPRKARPRAVGVHATTQHPLAITQSLASPTHAHRGCRCRERQTRPARTSSCLPVLS